MDELSKQVANALGPDGPAPTGEQLWHLRVRAGLTQAALAKLIRVSRPTLANWERGAHRPVRAHWQRIADVTAEIERQLAARGAA